MFQQKNWKISGLEALLGKIPDPASLKLNPREKSSSQK